MRIRKIWILISVLVLTLFVIYKLFIHLYVLFPWAVPWVSNMIIANPPKPEITYGEFPISITYEVKGEIRVIEDTVICEFDGIELRGEAGKYRKWKSSLKSGNNSLVFLPVDQDVTIEVGIFRGSPNYYMGDFEQSKEEYERVMNDSRFREYTEWKRGVQTGHTYSDEEIWEKYKLKILDIKYSQPINNKFK